MTKIKIKNSTTASGIPTSGSLLRGELAVNIADQRIFIGDASGNPVELTSQTVVSTSGVAGVTSISSNPSGIYVSQSTGAVTLGLVSNVFVSGALHVSGVIAQSPASLNLYASEDPVTNISRMINMKSYGSNYGEINVTDDGILSLSSTSNVIELRASGVSTVQLDATASTGYIFLTPTNIYIGGSSAVTTLPGGIISTTNTSGSVFDATALRVNIGGGASGVQIGHPTGTVVMGNIAVNSGTISTTALAGDIFNATAARINIGAAASGVKIGNATGVVTVGDVAVNNGAITTTAATATLFNATASRVNIGAGASGVLIGNATGVVTVGDVAVNNGAITTTAATATLFNATASRVNIGGGASGVQIGHPTGTVVMGNIAANSGTISTTATSASIFNANALSLNIGGGASGVQIGHPTGTVVMGNIAVNSGTISTTALAGDIFNATAARINIGAAASGVKIGNATGVVVVGDIAVNNGTISTTAATATLFDATATTVTIGSAATTTNIGAITGNQTVNIGAGNSALFTTKTINIGTNGIYGSVSNVNIGSANNGGTVTVNGTLAVSSGTLTTSNSTGTIFNTGTSRINIGGGASGVQIGHPTGTVVVGNLAVNSGTISTTATSGSLFNSAATTINIGGAASTMTIGSSTGACQIDVLSNTIYRPTLRYYNEPTSSPAISANALTLDLSTAQIFTVSLNSPITTLTISNTPATSNRSIGFSLLFTADGTGRAVTWPAAIKWSGGVAPTLTSTNLKKDMFTFITINGGTEWLGFIAGQNF